MQPQHRVQLAAFEIRKFEVTQRQWNALIEINHSYFEHPDHPVAQISWKRLHDFLVKLNALDPAHTYRLPTEAEWEYACRAGSTAATVDDLDAVAWYYEPSPAPENPQPHSVG